MRIAICFGALFLMAAMLHMNETLAQQPLRYSLTTRFSGNSNVFFSPQEVSDQIFDVEARLSYSKPSRNKLGMVDYTYRKNWYDKTDSLSSTLNQAILRHAWGKESKYGVSYTFQDYAPRFFRSHNAGVFYQSKVRQETFYYAEYQFQDRTYPKTRNSDGKAHVVLALVGTVAQSGWIPTLTYTFETFDAKSRDFSYKNHGFEARAFKKFPAFQVTGSYGLRIRDYETARRDNRLTFNLKTDYQLKPRFWVEGEYRNVNNSSNVSSKSYDQGVFSVGLKYMWP